MSSFPPLSSVEEVKTQEKNSGADQHSGVCDTKDEDFYSLEHTCRTCSRNIEDNQMLLPIFETKLEFNMSPIEVIEEIHFASLKIQLDDGLPQQICIDCMTNLTNIKSYRKECENNQVILSTYFHNKSKISSINKIDYSISNNEIFQLNKTDETYKVEIEKYGTESEGEEEANNCIDQDDENSFVNVEDCAGNIDNEKDDHQNNEKLVETASNNNIIVQQNVQKKSNRISRNQKDKGIRKKIVQCPFCKNIFRNKSALELHRRKFHPKRTPSRNICPICNQVFSLASILNDHLQTHNVEKPFKCDICDKCFNTKLNLSRHKARLHIKGDFECSICFRILDSKALYNYHMKSHNPDKKYKCQYCEKSFLQRHHLSNHESTHTGLRPFKCEICAKDFVQEHDFKVHLLRHSGVRPYACKFCGKDFSYQCSLSTHMRIHTGIKPFQCHICGKKFTQSPALTTHLRIHTGERPYKCDECDRAFTQKHKLRYHKYSNHDGPPPGFVKISPYSCHLCSKKFKLHKTLEIHIKNHSVERKFKCLECDSAFKRADALKGHFDRIHLKLKRFLCQYCDKAFASKSDLNLHMRTHNIHSNNKNKSLKTRNLDKIQKLLTTTQREQVLMTSAVNAASEESTAIEEYFQDINNVDEEVEVDI